MCGVQWNERQFLTIYMAVLIGWLVIESKADCAIDCTNSTLQTSNCNCSDYRNVTTVCTALSLTTNKTTVISIISMTATSIYDKHHAARDALLGNTSSAWCAGNVSQQYLQINLGGIYELQTIATQGLQSTNISGHVTGYTIQFSLDSYTWYRYQETNRSADKIFLGNNDTRHISCYSLNNSYTGPLVARFVRVYPVNWTSHICMRMALLGVPRGCFHKPCRVIGPCTDDVENNTACLCPLGFYRNGRRCEDIDECMANSTCPTNTICTNTPGSFTCPCKHGYHGNAGQCIDIDECTTGNHCSPIAQCTNIIGSYSCRCLSGYYGNGRTCRDVDECKRDLHSCHSNTSCINIHGSYRCSCQVGYEGFNCTAVSVTSTAAESYLGLAIGLPVLAVVIVLCILAALLILRRRRRRVIRRPKTSNKTGSRPSSTVIGQIDKLFDDERKLQDSVSLHSLQFSIPSVHPSLTALNNTGLTTKASPYEILQP